MAEFVWDYPRPPRVEPTARRIRVELGGQTIVDTRAAYRVLETSHPPTYYVALDDVAPGVLEPSPGRTTVCEWKGIASYYDVVAGGQRARRAAWTYHDPLPGFEAIRHAVAFYPAPMDSCWVDDERSSRNRAASTAAGSRPTSSDAPRARAARPASSRSQPALGVGRGLAVTYGRRRLVGCFFLATNTRKASSLVGAASLCSP